MDIQQHSPRLNQDSADVDERPIAPVLGPAVPVLKQGEHHDSCLSAPNAEEMATPLPSSQPVVSSKTAGAPEKSAMPLPDGKYGADGKFHYKDSNGERVYDITELVFQMRQGLHIESLTSYPEMVRYQCIEEEMSKSNARPDIRQLLKDSITSDEYKIRILVREVRYAPKPAAAALAKVSSLHLKNSYLFDLAVLLAKVDGCGVARHFREFGVTDPQECFNVALACLKANPRSVPDLLGNFGLTSAQRFRLALAMVESAADEVCVTIGGYDIEDEADRLAVALACADDPDAYLLLNIDNFAITDAASKYQIGLRSARSNPEMTISGLWRLGIKDRDQLFTIVMACLSHAGASVAECFPSLGLAGSDRIFELVMACIPSGAAEVAEHFQNFGITDQGQIESLSQACALADGEGTAKHVKNFGLKNQKFMRQLGLVCAAQDGGAARHFENFDYDDLDYKMCFAMACAHSNGFVTASLVKEFRFPDDAPTRAFLWRLACACANQNGNMIIEISNFGTFDPDKRDQLMLKCFKNGAEGDLLAFEPIIPELVSIRHFGGSFSMNLERATKQIVTFLLIADQNGGFHKNRQKNAWIKLGGKLAKLPQYPSFKLFASDLFDDENTSEPHPLLIPDPAGLLPCEAACEKMKVFGGKASIAKLSSSQIAVLAQIDAANFANYFRVHANGDLVPQPKLGNPIARLKKAGIVLTPEELKDALSVVTKANKDQVFLQARNKAFFDSLFELLKNPKEPASGKQETPQARAARLTANAKWTRDVLIQVDLHEFSAELLNALLPLLKAIHSLRDARVRKDLTALVFETSPQLLALWQKEADKLKPQNAIPLLCVLPYLAQQPSLKEALDSDAKTKSPRLDNYKASRPLIKSFRTLQESELASDTKSGILKAIFPEAKPDIDTIIARMRKLESLLGLSEERAEKLTQPDNTQSLDALLTAALEERLALKKPLNLEVFQKTFGSYREPDTLLVYAGRIAGRTRPIEGLREFVEAVLEGRYPAIRYEQAGLFAGCSPAFVEKWKTNRRVAFNEVIAGSKSSIANTHMPRTASARYFMLISDEILRDNHLPMARGGLLESYLRDKTKAAQLLAITDDNEAGVNQANDVMPVNTGSAFAGVNSTSSSSSSSSSSAGNPALHEFQRQCIAFLEAPTLEALHGLKASLAALDPTSELNQALAVMQADMLGVDRDHDPATLSFVFTDDHQQFMRMGSDMDGSCQRIDGDPRLNQGVVGTIHDGNSRLCLIEDEDGVIIGRAILRRVSIEEKEKDCLLMEPIYPPLLSEELSTALSHWTTLCAVDLGLDMAVLTKDESLPDCTDTLVSGPLRYALYSDGAGGIVDSGFSVDSLSAQRQENRLAWRHRHANMST